MPFRWDVRTVTSHSIWATAKRIVMEIMVYWMAETIMRGYYISAHQFCERADGGELLTASSSILDSFIHWKVVCIWKFFLTAELRALHCPPQKSSWLHAAQACLLSTSSSCWQVSSNLCQTQGEVMHKTLFAPSKIRASKFGLYWHYLCMRLIWGSRCQSRTLTPYTFLYGSFIFSTH